MQKFHPKIKLHSSPPDFAGCSNFIAWNSNLHLLLFPHNKKKKKNANADKQWKSRKKRRRYKDSKTAGWTDGRTDNPTNEDNWNARHYIQIIKIVTVTVDIGKSERREEGRKETIFSYEKLWIKDLFQSRHFTICILVICNQE